MSGGVAVRAAQHRGVSQNRSPTDIRTDISGAWKLHVIRRDENRHCVSLEYVQYSNLVRYVRQIVVAYMIDPTYLGMVRYGTVWLDTWHV